MKLAADDVQSLVIPDCGHQPAEEAPEGMLAALTAFLAPYRDGPATAAQPQAACCPGTQCFCKFLYAFREIPEC